MASPNSCRYLKTAVTRGYFSTSGPEDLVANGVEELLKVQSSQARDAFRLQVLSIPEAGLRWAAISVETLSATLVS